MRTVQGLLIVLAFNIFNIPGNTMAENRRTITDMVGRQVTITR